MMKDIPRLFGTSGIRGKLNENITPQLALELGMALATHIGKENKVVIGYDPRTSSPMLAHAVIAGLVQCGVNVLTLGMVPTPVVGYATKKLNADAGVMITASHNNSPYNGIKVWNPDGMAYRQEQERELEAIIHQKKFDKAPWNQIGSEEDISSFVNKYVEDILQIVKIKPGLKVVVDSANGAASYLSPLILRKTGCEVLTINSQPDGFFPGRNPEPSEANLGELMKVVEATKADLGIAHDGDADRMIAVDDKGRMAEFDKLLALISAQRGGLVITTVDASACIDRCMKNVGGHVERTLVGDVHVAEMISQKKARFGGEPSGTWLHPEFCMCPDGILSALRVIELIQQKGPLSDLLDDLPTYPTLRERFDCPEEQKDNIMEKMVLELPELFSDIVNINSIDGVRITLKDDSWVLVRPSGTESFIRITLEAQNDERADFILTESKKLLLNIIKGLEG